MPPRLQTNNSKITYRAYQGEDDLPSIISLVQSELSEPYIIYTYRYFLHNWPHLSFLALSDESTLPIGVVVSKRGMHRQMMRGYIAMLSVDKTWRNKGIAKTLVNLSVSAMQIDKCDEVILETEHDNTPAISLYESLGFIREKRLHRFYMNGKDAFRLVLVLPTDEDDDDGNMEGRNVGRWDDIPEMSWLAIGGDETGDMDVGNESNLKMQDMTLV